ncbi:hypothetical protein quinque_013864 [Culex quinquefasciatus]
MSSVWFHWSVCPWSVSFVGVRSVGLVVCPVCRSSCGRSRSVSVCGLVGVLGWSVPGPCVCPGSSVRSSGRSVCSVAVVSGSSSVSLVRGPQSPVSAVRSGVGLAVVRLSGPFSVLPYSSVIKNPRFCAGNVGKSETPENLQGFGSYGGAGAGRGERGRSRGRGGKEDSKEWVPVTKLGRLVRDGKIRALEEVYLYSLPIMSRSLKYECVTFVAIGDSNGHICLGVKYSKEVATAIRSAIILAKLSVVPVRRGYWGNKIGKPHTVPCKVFAGGTCHPIYAFPTMIDTDVRYLCASLSNSSLTGASLVEDHGHTTSTILPIAYATAPTTTYGRGYLIAVVK